MISGATLRPTLQASAKWMMVSARRTVSSSSTSSLGAPSSIGFIGLGNMGLPMALNLAKKSSSPVLAFDLNESSMKEASDGGANLAKSVIEIGASCNVIFSMLPGCAAVHSVMGSLMSASRSVSQMVVVDCSTVSPITARQWHDAWQAKGHAMLDAPVSGGVRGASEATLTFMVGNSSAKFVTGTPTALDVAQPLLEHMGRRIVICGGPGAGAATKLCNNLALAAQMAGICEAMNLGDALGVDPVVLAQVMNTSTAKSWSCEVNNPHPAVAAINQTPAALDYQGGFSAQLMLKDLGLAVDAGQANNVALPIGNATKELYRMATLQGKGSKDFGVLLQFLRGK